MLYIDNKKKHDCKSAQSCLEPLCVLILDLESQAVDLVAAFPDAFVQPPSGVYLKNHIHPILHSGRRYYLESKFNNGITVEPTLEALAQHREAVVDECGGIVIPTYLMQHQARTLRSTPPVYASALSVIKTEIETYIQDCTRVQKAEIDGELSAALTPSGFALWESGDVFDTIISKCFQDVSEFIGEDEWNIYFVRLTNSVLYIEKCSDYRIYAYYKQEELKNSVD